MRERNEFVWLRVGFSGGILSTPYWTFWFRKAQGIFMSFMVKECEIFSVS